MGPLTGFLTTTANINSPPPPRSFANAPFQVWVTQVLFTEEFQAGPESWVSKAAIQARRKDLFPTESN